MKKLWKEMKRLHQESWRSGYRRQRLQSPAGVKGKFHNYVKKPLEKNGRPVLNGTACHMRVYRYMIL